MNPKHMHNNGTRIIKTIDGKSQEVFYFETTNKEQLEKVERIISDGDTPDPNHFV